MNYGEVMISLKPVDLAIKSGVKLPDAYHFVKDLNLVRLKPWHFVADEEFYFLFNGINKRYPERRVIPFARREDNDDVACFVDSDLEQGPGEIIIIHDLLHQVTRLLQG